MPVSSRQSSIILLIVGMILMSFYRAHPIMVSDRSSTSNIIDVMKLI